MTGGHGEFTNTTYAKVGDLGSQLPYFNSGVTWKAGEVVTTMWSLRANHGGGYQYRLCKLEDDLTEECFQKTPVAFADDSSLMLSNGTMMKLKSTFVREGTLPLNSTWQMNPIPGYVIEHGTASSPGWKYCDKPGPQCRWFAPPCEDEYALHPQNLGQGLCSGEWLTNVTFYDRLRVPKNLSPGKYVLGFRWDCESSAQIWQSCSDITIVDQ
jgi:hypothetical protein